MGGVLPPPTILRAPCTRSGWRGARRSRKRAPGTAVGLKLLRLIPPVPACEKPVCTRVCMYTWCSGSTGARGHLEGADACVPQGASCSLEPGVRARRPHLSKVHTGYVGARPRPAEGGRTSPGSSTLHTQRPRPRPPGLQPGPDVTITGSVKNAPLSVSSRTRHP